MTFHRLTSPSYFGGLPGGYDLINTGGAPADNAKVGGPNAGTYFHAFGEDAVSVFFNRPIKALAQNTDLLDDLIHRDVVVMHKTADVLAGGPVASVVLPAGTYLGGAGYANNAVSRARLFSVRDNSDQPILDASLNEVLVTSLTLSGGDAIGGGFSANSVTLNLSPSIPTSVTYRVYNGVRQNLATIDTDVIPSGREFALIYGHTTMATRAHAASAIAYAGGVVWADGTTNPATTVEAQLDKILTDLAEHVSIGGALRVGYVPEGGSWFTGATVGIALNQVSQAFTGVAPIVNLQISGTLAVEGMSTLASVTLVDGLDYNSSDLTIGPGGLILGGGFHAQFQGPVAIDSSVAINQLMTFGASNDVRYPSELFVGSDLGPDSSFIYQISPNERYIRVAQLDHTSWMKPSAAWHSGNVVEISTKGMDGGFLLGIYNQDDVLILTMGPSSNCYAKFVMVAGVFFQFG